MKRARIGELEGSPFDLALDTPPATAEPSDREMQPELPLEAAAKRPLESGEETSPGFNQPAPGDLLESAAGGLINKRLAGGTLDFAIHLAVLASAVAGSWWLGVPPSRVSFFPLLLFILSFSFVYHVLPLTFWGHTPGMASVGLLARSLDGGPLTIAQTILRWLGVLVIVLSLGLLFLVRPHARSIPDRLSGSVVRS